MTQKAAIAYRQRLLQSLRRRKFVRCRFVGDDALVTRVFEATRPTAAVKAKIDEHLPCRLYPIPGGYLIKWLYEDSGLPSGDFAIEAGGWNHEHCDICNRTIDVGDTAWLTARGSLYHLCRYCYGRVVHLRRADGTKRARPANDLL